MPEQNSNLNKILQKQGDFLGRKFNQVKETAIAEANAYTDTQISNVIGGAPETLDTLKELADALTSSDSAIKDIKDILENHRHDNATQTADGFMSKEDKAFLDSIGTYEQFVAAFNAAVGAESPFYEK